MKRIHMVEEKKAKGEGTGTKSAATNAVVAADVVVLTVRNQELQDENKTQADEIKGLKAQLSEANAALDAQIRGTLYPKIQAVMPHMARAKLDEMTPKELHELYVTLNAIVPSKLPKANVVAVSKDSTVILDSMPNMYGKTHAQILEEMRGS
jgi:hypothetical protein